MSRERLLTVRGKLLRILAATAISIGLLSECRNQEQPSSLEALPTPPPITALSPSPEQTATFEPTATPTATPELTVATIPATSEPTVTRPDFVEAGGEYPPEMEGVTPTPETTATTEVVVPPSLEQIIANLREKLNLTVPEEFAVIEKKEYNRAPDGGYNLEVGRASGATNVAGFSMGGEYAGVLGRDSQGNLLILIRTSSGSPYQKFACYSSEERLLSEPTTLSKTTILSGASQPIYAVVGIGPDTLLKSRHTIREPSPIQRGLAVDYLGKMKVGLPLNYWEGIPLENFTEWNLAFKKFCEQGYVNPVFTQPNGEPYVFVPEEVDPENPPYILVPGQIWPLQ